MTRRRWRVMIIGAGVAGLTASIALRRTGHDVLLFERTPEIQPLGAGLVLWSNATAALCALDLMPAMRKIGNELTGASIMSSSGRVLSQGDMSTPFRATGTPTLAVHRADLLGSLQQHTPESHFRFDHELIDFEERPDSVVATFANGTQQEADVLIGADGIWSRVRRVLHGEVRPRYSGYSAWRGVVDFPLAGSQSSASFESWGCGTRFGWVPLSGDRVYWFAVKNAPEGQNISPNGHRAELVELFGDWHEPIPETIRRTPESVILRHDIYDRDPVRRWGTGRVTLAGDAAHPMTPNTGQGAATSIEDALVLANSLSRHPTLEPGLLNYEVQRYERTKALIETSRRIGGVAQTENRVLCRMRDLAMRIMPRSISDRQLARIVDWEPPSIDDLTE